MTKDKEGHYIMIKGSIQEEDITTINVCAANTDLTLALGLDGNSTRDGAYIPLVDHSGGPRSRDMVDLPKCLSNGSWMRSSLSKTIIGNLLTCELA